MANTNDGEVKRVTTNMNDLGEFTDDELGGTTILTVLTPKVVPPEGGPIPENQPLSHRIRLCTNMTELRVVNCSSLPPEISNCPKLSQLFLSSCDRNDDDCRIELPEGIILSNLTTVSIGRGGKWNTSGIINWLATCSSNLRQFSFVGLTKETANQFMTELQNNNAFIEKFKHKLQFIAFINCNLNEDDARVIIFDMKPLYSRLVCIDLRDNNIESLETIGTLVRETLPANTNQLLPSSLFGLLLKGNPCFDNLNDPKSPDSVVMIDLLKYHPWLCRIGSYTDETLTYLPMIDYLLMMNRSGLRYLLDDGHGGTRLSGILPHVMNHAYIQRKQDPTSIFTLLREGPIFRTQYDNNDDSDDDDGDDDEYDLSLLLRHHH